MNDENSQIDVIRRRIKTGAAFAIDAYAILRSLSYEIEIDVLKTTPIISLNWRFPNFDERGRSKLTNVFVAVESNLIWTVLSVDLHLMRDILQRV